MRKTPPGFESGACTQGVARGLGRAHCFLAKMAGREGVPADQEQVAAAILTPLAHEYNHPIEFPKDGFLQKLREITPAHGMRFLGLFSPTIDGLVKSRQNDGFVKSSRCKARKN